MNARRRTWLAAALLLGAVSVGGALEIALARSGGQDVGGGRWLRWPPRDTGWQAHVAVVDRALAVADVSGAVRAWHDAYGAALASGQWEALVEVGDAFVRIGDAAASAAGSRSNARQAYLAALVRAQRDGSADGARRVARAFEALGDHAVAAQCGRIASRLAERGGARPG
jgi:hypothetical protein